MRLMDGEGIVVAELGNYFLNLNMVTGGHSFTNNDFESKA